MFSAIERFLRRKPQEQELPTQVPYLEEKHTFDDEKGICGQNKYDLENAAVLGVVEIGDKVNLVVKKENGNSKVLVGLEYIGFIKAEGSSAVRHRFKFMEGEIAKYEIHSWDIIGWKKITPEANPQGK